MRLFTDHISPNPRAVDNIVAIKELYIEVVPIDLMGGENRGADYLKVNPAGQLPALETDDGQIIAEVAAIAEYLEEIKPDPVLVGVTAAERAHTRMRMRQCDYLVLGPMMMAYRNSEGAEFFKQRMLIQPELGAPLKNVAAEGLAWLDGQLAEQSYICGARLTYVDCAFYPLARFIAKVSQPFDPKWENLAAYMDRLSAHEIIGAKKLGAGSK